MTLHPAFGLSFADLYTHDGLSRLDAAFAARLADSDAALHNRLMQARAEPGALADKDHSQLLIDLAPQVEDFIGELFGIGAEIRSLAEAHDALAPLYACKRLFVQRRAAKLTERESWSEEAFVTSETFSTIHEFELYFARKVMGWLNNEENHKTEIESAMNYAAWALYSEEGRRKHRPGLLFRLPKKLDFTQLVPCETEIREGVTMLRLSAGHLRPRDGFALTDAGGSLAQALDHAHYCIVCHHQGRDSCAKGMREKDGSFRVNALNVALAGCPLEEHISEMNHLKSVGVPVGALAAVCVSNPMCAGTGHRICNDCMKACIYQKQEPVNIPMVETRVLSDVLALPFGFEIYSLLTRWNPLNVARPLPKPPTGKRVLVAGLGPSGYTLSHHLLNDGHTVMAIDGLKIEPLNVAFEPVRDARTLAAPLDERSQAGFGGVAEYGITVRWDKNYLTLIRLLLERREHFALAGGVRFGGTITRDDAFALGFDHIALCLGAGKPNVLNVPNGVARGVRAASDFLMSLQLTGAAKKESIANLQLRLPVVVVGGGLTAIDTATEALAYYPVQVEKFLARYEALCAAQGEENVRSGWSAEEEEIAGEFIAHAKQIRAERESAAAQGRTPDFIPLLKRWGGATIAYRKRLVDAPSYRLNHEEVEKAMEEGIVFAENLTPLSVELDRHGHAASLVCQAGEGKAALPARAILVAAGTQPNTVLAREEPENFTLDGIYFQAVDEDGNPVSPERSAKPEEARMLMHVSPEGKSMSFFGDLHPSFAGNVVKAMASAKRGYPLISRMLAKLPARPDDEEFLRHILERLHARVHAVNRLTPNIVEVVIHAPLAAKQFRPGQFFRLQNFEAAARPAPGTLLTMEGLALTGASADAESGLLSLIVLEMGGSSDLCAHLQPGEAVVLMGPTGSPTEIPEGETVLLAGGGLGNAVLFSIGRALREAGSRVLYFAGYKKAQDVYKREEIEAASDVVVWCCDEALLAPGRAQDRAFHGNIVDAMAAYAAGELGAPPVAMDEVKRIIVIGSDRMMAAVAAARHGRLKPHLRTDHVAIGSINSPMQCMMKEICAQCLQRHRDPITGEETYVFSCFDQDQRLDRVDFSHLSERLRQNAIQEKLTMRWVAEALGQK